MKTQTRLSKFVALCVMGFSFAYGMENAQAPAETILAGLKQLQAPHDPHFDRKTVELKGVQAPNEVSTWSLLAGLKQIQAPYDPHFKQGASVRLKGVQAPYDPHFKLCSCQSLKAVQEAQTDGITLV